MRFDWISVIAIAGVIAAVGKFLDEYHMSNLAKDRVRDVLIRLFIIIESTTIPDIAASALRTFGWFTRQNALKRVMILYAILTLIWYMSLPILAIILGEGLQAAIDMGIELVSTIPIFVLLLMLIFFPITIFILVATILERLRGIYIRFSALSVIIIVVYIVIEIEFNLVYSMVFMFGGLGYETFALVILAAFFVPVQIPIFVAMILIIVRSILWLLQLVLMRLLDAASSPRTSPFLYASSLLSLLILVSKTVMEIVA